MANRHSIERFTRRILRKDIKKIVALSNIEKEELKMRILFSIKQNAVMK